MSIRLFDTARGEVRPLEQRQPGVVSMYVCGPTVDGHPHIGHGRMVLTYDVLRRYLEHGGTEVVHVSNITDIEDKIVARAAVRGVSTGELTAENEALWYSAMDRLGVLRPTHDPHATAYVEEMVALIGDLIDRGAAYETTDTIYFSPEVVSDYGLLARQSIESLRTGARVEADEQKNSPIDFALWKKTEEAPHWPSPWGNGRPGWHTECVVMSLDLLGDGFDLHTGGIDLAFPHHENERAQATAMGKTFARHWMHNGFVEMGGEKMSKSLGNFTSLTDLLDRHDARAYRLLVLRAHYRSPIEVTASTVADAEAAMARLDDFARRFHTMGTKPSAETAALLQRFHDHMDDDLDTPRALAVIFSAVREANSALDRGDDARAESLAAAVFEASRAVGLIVVDAAEGGIDERTKDLIRRRDEARQAKDWATADELRAALESDGWVVEDTPQGTRVHR